MYNQEAPDHLSWWERLVAGLPTAPERDSIWSVPRPFVRLYLVLFAIQAGWLISLATREVLASHGSQGMEAIAYETLSALSQPGVGAAISSLLIVEVTSYLMVMYNFLMYHLVRPIIQRHERRGEAQGIAIGAERTDQEWRAWYQRLLDSQARGEPFDEQPPPPPHQNGAQQPED